MKKNIENLKTEGVLLGIDSTKKTVTFETFKRSQVNNCNMISLGKIGNGKSHTIKEVID